jgi:hypothetical protein
VYPKKIRLLPYTTEVPAKTISNICTFLETVGVLRIFIKGFAQCAHHLVKLTQKDAEFEWGANQEQAQANLIKAVLKSPALWPLNYESLSSIILAVDTSYIAIGYFLAQCNEENSRV